MEIRLEETQKIKILNAEDVFSIMQKILLQESKIEQDKAHFWIIGLASNNQLLFVELVSFGGTRYTIVEPVNVFRVAVLKNAVQMILVSNHPSGELEPSEAEKDMTDRLIQGGRIISVPVIDHLIITLENFYSFVDAGLYAELQQSLKWMPPYEVIEGIRAEEEKIRQDAVQAARENALKDGIEKGQKQQALKMTRALKQYGVDPKVIAQASGLSVSDIKKL